MNKTYNQQFLHKQIIQHKQETQGALIAHLSTMSTSVKS